MKYIFGAKKENSDEQFYTGNIIDIKGQFLHIKVHKINVEIKLPCSFSTQFKRGQNVNLLYSENMFYLLEMPREQAITVPEKITGIVCALNYSSDYNIAYIELNEETQTAALAKVFDTNIIAGSGLSIYDYRPFIYDRKIQRCYSIVQDADYKWHVINSSVDDEGVAIHTPIGLTEFDDVGGAYVYYDNLAAETASTRAFYYSTNRKYIYILLKVTNGGYYKHKWVKVALSSGAQTLINEERYDSEHYDGWPEDVETNDETEVEEILENPLYYDELTASASSFPKDNSILTLKDTGDTSSGKWHGGALLESGKVIFAPYGSRRYVIYDPDANTLDTIAPNPYHINTGCVLAHSEDHEVVFVPYSPYWIYMYSSDGVWSRRLHNFEPLDTPEVNCWNGGVLTQSGKIVFVPDWHQHILTYEPYPFDSGDFYMDMDKVTFKDTGDASFYKWHGGALTQSGKVIFVPHNSRYIGIYDPDANTFTTKDTGDTSSGKWHGGVLTQSGKVIFVPHNSRYIGIYDPDANTFTTKDTGDTSSGKWHGGVLTQSGKVIFVPHSSRYIGIYDPDADTFITKDTGDASLYKWAGGVLTQSGKVIFVPYNSRYIGILEVDCLANISVKSKFLYNTPNKSELNRIFVSTRQIEAPVPPLKETAYYLNTFDKTNIISATGYKTIDGETTYYQDIDYTLMEVVRVGLSRYQSVNENQNRYSDWHDPLPFISVGGQTYLLVAKNGRNSEGEEIHTLGFLNVDTRVFISTGRTSYDSTPHIYVAPDNSYALLVPDSSNPIMLFSNGDFSNTNFKGLINIDTIERRKTLMCAYFVSPSGPPAIIDYSPASPKVYAIDWETYGNMPVFANNKIYASLSEGYYIYDGNIGKLMLTDFDEDDEPGDFSIPSFDGYAGKAWIKWYAVDNMLGSSVLFEAPLIN